jgi:hypothetical protein
LGNKHLAANQSPFFSALCRDISIRKFSNLFELVRKILVGLNLAAKSRHKIAGALGPGFRSKNQFNNVQTRRMNEFVVRMKDFDTFAVPY